MSLKGDMLMKDKIIDEMIEKVIMYFQEDEITKLIIKRLAEMRLKEDIVKDGNTVFFKDPKFLRAITIDKDRKILVLTERGQKRQNLEEKQFENTIYYNINEGNGVIVKETKDIDKKLIRGQKEQTEAKVTKYKYYKENKEYSSSVEKKDKKTIMDENDTTILEQERTNNILNYELIYGDYIQRQEKDGKVNYYYYYKYEPETYSKIKITEEDFKRFVAYDGDAYGILNDKLFSNLRR